jgi:hypothetical protein
MRLFALLIGVLLPVSLAAAAEDSAAAVLLKLEQERCKAISEQNFSRLSDLLAEDLVHVHTSGAAQDKATYLNGLKGRPRTTYRGKDLKVRVYGNVAVMTGAQFNQSPGNNPAQEMFVTQVWVRAADTWKQSSFQATNNTAK